MSCKFKDFLKSVSGKIYRYKDSKVEKKSVAYFGNIMYIQLTGNVLTCRGYTDDNDDNEEKEGESMCVCVCVCMCVRSWKKKEA